ncbi:MAG: hypothetical protein LBH38_01585 [Holosporales bacterium]|jgi:DNA-3-methyladenine glycosylase II|nr:hypothetical protein [Holosporales bacterium]
MCLSENLPPYWEEACCYLRQHDSVLASCMDESYLISHGNGFSTLVHAIIGQQISVKAAEKITERLKISDPSDALMRSSDEMLAAGLSRQKVAYITGIARFWETQEWKMWPTLSDAHLMEELIKLKGVGRWTAEMFLIFHCMRPDIFPKADLGVQKAIATLYKVPVENTIEIVDRWRPYRTVATWYLWRSLDAIPVRY